MYSLLTMKVYPDTVVEDDDQYEIDGVFGMFLILYTVYLATLRYMYDGEDFVAVSKFNILFSNLFSFFPIYQAQGLFLKCVLLGTLYYSLCYHFVEGGQRFATQYVVL